MLLNVSVPDSFFLRTNLEESQMFRVAAVCVSAALAGSLAACSPPPGPGPAPQTSAAPPPAQSTASSSMPSSSMPAGQAQGGLDGVYRAPAGGASGNSACGTTRFGYPIRVANGVASMQTVSQGRLEGPVGPDGSLNIQNGRANLRGQFSGGQFNGTYNVDRCGFALNYHK